MTSNIDLLIKNCKKGSQKAQLQIYRMYCEGMFFIACRYIKDEEEAKDIVQEGFLKAFQNINANVEAKSFGAWLKRIIINLSLDHLRKKKLETVSIENYSLEVILDDEDNWQVDEKVTREQVEKAIESLDDKYQWVVKLYLMEGYDHTEISEILKIPTKTSRTRLWRGKLLLKEQLKNDSYETGS